MDVIVAGGHGQIALRLLRLLSDAGHRGRGIVRDPDQAGDLEAAGGEAIVADLEREDLAGRIGGADAVVFAAGAGPGSGEERKRTMDYGGAVNLIEAARADGVRRYVMVSAIGARNPDAGPEAMRPYLRAKADADRALLESGLDLTIVRPGSLTDDPGTGLVDAAGTLDDRGEIPRDDVAAVLLACLESDVAIDKVFEVVSGDTTIAEAIATI
jgi:nucleoside-diphosphate-sugar epimerase